MTTTPNTLRRGLIRLWLALSFFWLLYAGYMIYDTHTTHQNLFSYAKLRSEGDEERRTEGVKRYVAAAKARLIPGEPTLFNPEKAADFEYTRITLSEEFSTSQKETNRLFEQSFETRDVRDFYLKLIAIIPVGLGLLLGAIYWVVQGFKPKT